MVMVLQGSVVVAEVVGVVAVEAVVATMVDMTVIIRMTVTKVMPFPLSPSLA
jgi:hypothetical protein